MTEAERKAYAKGWADCRAMMVRLIEERAAREHRLADSFKDSRQGHYRAVARQLEALAKDARKVNPAGQSHDG